MRTPKWTLRLCAASLLALAAPAFAAGQADKDLLEVAKALFKPLPTAEQMQEKHAFTDAQVKLGKVLYFDPRLSRGGTLSCNSCHNLASSGVDNMSFSQGHKGQFGGRNSPTVLNASLFIAQFWDGRAADVEEQAGGPLLNPLEMAMPDEASVEKVLRSIPDYGPMFDAAYGKGKKGKANITFKNATDAIGAFERTLLTPSRFDQYLAGDINALTPPERAGLKKFIDVGCISCHTGVGLGGDQFQKFGLVQGPYWKFTGSAKPDDGRFEVTQVEDDQFVFRVPGLRNVARTYPYFHDGSVWSLEKAVDIMGEAQLGQKMSGKDVKSIVTFLNALTGDVPAAALVLPTLPTAGPDTPRPDND
ncbi:MAG: cytochrome-c peroxidase [Neisseria sp.]|nr:cytochrome-c peroxidase [Neisseria sp.]